MVQTRRRKTSAILAIALSFAVVTLGLFRISEAGFSAQTGSTAAWETGTVALTDDDSGTAMFSTGTDGLLDGGQSLTRCLAVTYSGTLTANIGVRLHGSAAGALAPYLGMTIEEGSGGGAGTCAGFTSARSLYSGTLSAFASGHGTFATGVSTWAIAGTPETRTYRIVMTVQNVPAAQSESATGTLTWEAGVPPPIPDLYEQAVLADNPEAYYRLGEASGATMTDSSGNGRAGTYTSMTLGQTGATLSGNTGVKTAGRNSRGLVPGAAWMDKPTWTVEAWTRMSPIATDAAAPIASRLYQPGMGSADPGWVWLLTHTSDGRVQIRTYNGGVQSVTSSPVMFDLAWHQVAATYDGTTVRLYVDGAQVGSMVATPRRNAVSDFVVGNLRSPAGDDFGYGSQYCDQDEVSFYGTALPAANILAHYQAAKGL